jgi:hypothetical protein
MVDPPVPVPVVPVLLVVGALLPAAGDGVDGALNVPPLVLFCASANELDNASAVAKPMVASLMLPSFC